MNAHKSQPVVKEVAGLREKDKEKAFRLFQQIIEKEGLQHSTLAREFRDVLVQNRILKGSSVNIDDLIMEYDREVRVKDVILSKQNKHIINYVMKEHAAKAKLLNKGLYPISTILFEGASGTGKTYLGQALGNELGYRMLYIDNGRAYTPGQMLRSIDAIFTEIRENKGGISVFMDEIEVVAWNRASKNATDESKAALTSLFQNIDQLKRDRLDFLLIFSTNLKQQLDDAFVRRCEVQMLFTVPDSSLLSSINHFVTMSEIEGVPSQFTLDLENSRLGGKKIDLNDPATQHILKPILNSYDAIRRAVQRAKKMCVMAGRYNITLNDIIIAAKNISSSDGSQMGSVDQGLVEIKGGKKKVFNIDDIKEAEQEEDDLIDLRTQNISKKPNSAGAEGVKSNAERATGFIRPNARKRMEASTRKVQPDDFEIDLED